MLKKTIYMLSVLSFVGACSHHRPMMKKSSHPYKVGKSFLDIIKTKKPFSPQDTKRLPSSAAKSIPGLAQFMAALKTNPEFLKVPVGMEVSKTEFEGYSGDSHDIEDWRNDEKIVYLVQKPDGYFVLENSQVGQHFILYETEQFETVQRELSTADYIKQFKKLSATKFLMVFDVPAALKGISCQVEIDLTKSSELTGSACKDSKGKIISESRVVAVKKINISDYADSLKNVKLVVFPLALAGCNEGDPLYYCSASIIDAEEKDWSYILK